MAWLLISQYETVPLAVLEDRVSAPGLFLRCVFKFYAARLQFFIGFLDVVTNVRYVHERADAVLVLVGSEQNDACLRFRDAKLDPTLLIVERLIGDDRKA